MSTGFIYLNKQMMPMTEKFLLIHCRDENAEQSQPLKFESKSLSVLELLIVIFTINRSLGSKKPLEKST